VANQSRHFFCLAKVVINVVDLVDLNLKCSNWKIDYGGTAVQKVRIFSRKDFIGADLNLKCSNWKIDYGGTAVQKVRIFSRKDFIGADIIAFSILSLEFAFC
jgi:uncharacterized Zn ribbon protein